MTFLLNVIKFHYQYLRIIFNREAVVRIRFVAFALCLLAVTRAVQAEIPILSSQRMHCTRSATLLHCSDGRGSFYAVAQQGNQFYLRGFDARSGLSWAQTLTRLGRIQYFAGASSDFNLWTGSGRRIGWNQVNSFTTGDGERGQVSCNRLRGCR